MHLEHNFQITLFSFYDASLKLLILLFLSVMPSPIYAPSLLPIPINHQYPAAYCSFPYVSIHSILCPQDVLSKPAFKAATLVLPVCEYLILKAQSLWSRGK